VAVVELRVVFANLKAGVPDENAVLNRRQIFTEQSRFRSEQAEAVGFNVVRQVLKKSQEPS